MPDRVGQQLGNYRLVTLLGQGGYAEVYLGQHVRFKQQAAIKVLNTHLSGQEAEHFLHEAETIAALAHPSIVRVFDFDVQEGIPFLVMDYAPNGSLRQRYPQGQIVPIPQIVSLVKQVASALQYAHEQKFIHRDVKPENMLLGRHQEVLLSDFGLAALAHSSASLITQATVGTLPYMAPEQIEGRPRATSDQYALGVVVYEWLCGSCPFEGSMTEVMVKHLSMPPPPLHERVATILPEIEQVVLRTLAKDPKARFASVADFTAALERASQFTPAYTTRLFSEQPGLGQAAVASYATVGVVSSQPGDPADVDSAADQLIVPPSELVAPPGSSGAPDQASQGSARGGKTSLDLLERDRYFEQLSELFHTVTTGNGRTVLVSGEAGVGKTTLVEQFMSQRCRGARRLWGACEALFTPRPLGPLYDVAAQLGGTLSTLMSRDTERPTLFSALLDDLQKSAIPTVVVFEDVHRADEATLDLIKFLRLSPLSEQAVTHLARQAHRSGEQLYAITGGNPFFVTEVLAGDASGVPMTVRDAVLARVSRCSRAARILLELASVIPSRTERWLLDAVLGSTTSALEECLSSGMLTVDQMMVAFRHELARLAVESTLSPLRKQSLHTQVLLALLSHGEDTPQAARLVHHATGAQDEALVLRYAPMAAQQAATRGAHRQAAAQYATALCYVDRLPLEHQAELLEGRAYECYLTSQAEEAVQAYQAALRIWRQLDRVDKVGHTLRWLSRLSWLLARPLEAEQYAAEAVHLLETLPPGAELTMAYSNRAQLYVHAHDNTQAVWWGERAIALAESLGDVETLVHALNTVGTAQLQGQDEQGRANLERSLRIALERGWEDHASRAYNNLAWCAVDAHDYARAAHYLQDGIAYCTEHDLDRVATYLRAYQAHARFEQGAWDNAAQEATDLLDRYRLAPVIKILALVVLGWVRVRRGDPGSAAVLDEARTLALATGELRGIAPVALACAEAAWLQGNQEQCLAEARVGYDLALAHDANPWTLGELCVWMWRADGLSSAPGSIAEPFARQISGDWQGAAALWAQIGCPYEQALALIDGDVEAQLSALSIFERLGAQPAMALVRQRLRQQGIPVAEEQEN
jgi:serine/threonine protein kinase